MAKATTKTYKPSELAKELDVDPKQLRSYLRKEFPRDAEAKNTSWVITEAQAKKCRERFASDEDDEA